MIAAGRYGVQYEYRLVTVVGQGGFADVYRCEVFSVTGRRLESQPFAVKILREACHWENRDRFRREAQIQQSLRHPNLVPVLDYNLDAEPPFFVMPLMRETLQDRLSRMRRVREVYRAKPAIEQFILPLASAADYLHRRGYFHRDIKPENIFIGFDEVPRLGDLGVCHAPSALAQLKTWCGLGTPYYTAPETLRFGHATPQSDVYSLGVVLYEMVTGARPDFYWWTRGALRPSIQHPISCHPLVDKVVARMTHPDPRLRYCNVAAAMIDLRKLCTLVLPLMPAYRRPSAYVPRTLPFGARSQYGRG